MAGMRRVMPVVVVCAGVVMAAGSVRGQAGEGGRWAGVVEQLGSESFAVREAGQRELEKATGKDRSALVDLWAEARDGEVRARLLRGLETLEMGLVEKPAGVSVEVKGATLGEVAAAIAAGTGEACDVSPAAEGVGKEWRFTLSVKERSLWEVLGLLNEQHGVGLENEGMRLKAQAKAFVAHGEKGAVGVFVKPVERMQRAGKAIYSLMYYVAMDPRVGRMEFGVPQLESLVDDAGNELFPAVKAKTPVRWPGWEGMRGFGAGMELPVPAQPGKQIGSMKGVVVFKLHIGEQVVEGKELAGAMAKEVRVAGERVRIETAAQGEGRLRGVVWVEAVEAGRGEDEASGVWWELLDARGEVVGRTRLAPGRNEVAVEMVGEAVRGRLRACVRVKEVQVGFEVKDLALPG